MNPEDIRRAVRDGVLDALELVLSALSIQVSTAAAGGDDEAQKDLDEIEGFRMELYQVRKKREEAEIP